jgi:hypothetical protein
MPRSKFSQSFPLKLLGELVTLFELITVLDNVSYNNTISTGNLLKVNQSLGNPVGIFDAAGKVCSIGVAGEKLSHRATQRAGV